MILHWLGEMFDPALAGYWLGRDERGRDPDHARAMDVCARVIAANRGQDRRHQDLAARRGQGDRVARAAAGRRAHVHRRRLQLRGADRRRCDRPLGCAARHLRCDRAGGFRRAVRAGAPAIARGSTRSSRRRFRCRGTSSRRRRASTRRASCSWRGSTATSRISRWSADSRARAASCISPSCSGSPMPLAAARSRARRRADAHAARVARRRVNSPDPALLSINTATVRAQWPLPEIIAGSRVTAFAAYRRGATRWRRRGSTTARGAFATPASPSPAFAAAACSPRRTAKGAARRTTTTAAPSTRR